MSDRGNKLEALVALIEGLQLPPGFEVRTNTTVRSDDGLPVAEFDVEIRGKLGSTNIAWLIECRDRPSDGAASAAWIEQLVGRRERFGFNKITAVSTTGFSVGAIEYANKAGIELRGVREFTPERVNYWLATQEMRLSERTQLLQQCNLIVGPNESKDRKEAFERLIAKKKQWEPILRSTETHQLVSGVDAFEAALSKCEDLFRDLTPNNPTKQVTLRVEYPDDKSHFVVETEIGDVRITEILFLGWLQIKETDVPLSKTTEYARVESNESISQTAAFMIDTHQMHAALELHRISESGEIHVVLRGIGDSSRQPNSPNAPDSNVALNVAHNN